MVAELKRDFSSKIETTKPQAETPSKDLISFSPTPAIIKSNHKKPYEPLTNPGVYPTVKNRSNLINLQTQVSQSLSNLQSTPNVTPKATPTLVRRNTVISGQGPPKVYPKPQLGGRTLPKQILRQQPQQQGQQQQQQGQQTVNVLSSKRQPVMYVRFNSMENMMQRYSSLESINEI